MGDRTNVELTVLASQSKEAEALFTATADEHWEVDQYASYSFEEVNYGELVFLSQLTDAGIAFDSCWGAGDEYGSGTKSCRFTAEGVLELKEVYDCDLNPELLLLMQHINDPIKLKEIIEEHHKKVTSLPWDNQEQFGKIYRAAQLITPKTIT